MKLTERYLRSVIKEELNNLKEEDDGASLDNFGPSGMIATFGAGSLINPMVNLGTGGTIAAVAAVLSPFIQYAILKYKQSKHSSKKNLNEEESEFDLDEFREKFRSQLDSIARKKPALAKAMEAEKDAEEELYQSTGGDVDMYMKEIHKLAKVLEKYS